MIELKTPKEIEAMKPAGRFVGGILRDLKEFTKVGTNLLEIDEFVHKRIVDRKGASSCYVDYAPDFGTGPFAHYICTSVNDAVLHGVPYDYNLKDGDLVSLDLAINVDGWVADSAISFCVGTQHPDDLRLIKCTEEALAAGIEAAKLVENGLLVLTAGPALRFLPPLTITQAEMDKGLEILEKTLKEV